MCSVLQSNVVGRNIFCIILLIDSLFDDSVITNGIRVHIIVLVHMSMVRIVNFGHIIMGHIMVRRRIMVHLGEIIIWTIIVKFVGF